MLNKPIKNILLKISGDLERLIVFVRAHIASKGQRQAGLKTQGRLIQGPVLFPAIITSLQSSPLQSSLTCPGLSFLTYRMRRESLYMWDSNQQVAFFRCILGSLAKHSKLQIPFNSGFLSVYAQQRVCWVIWQFYFQFFKESPCCSP